jgi:O-antigen biosynthesis protein
MSYPSFLMSLNADIGIAPLEINKFNSAKSNLKHLEYVALDITGVYTDIDPYKKTQLKAKTTEQFIGHIESLENEKLRLTTRIKDRKTIGNDLFLEDNRREYINAHLQLFGKKVK